MASLTDLREALASNLAAIDGLQESAYVLANPTPPAAEVVPAPIEYDKAMGRGLDKWTFLVRVLVGLTSDIGAQKRLDKMLASAGPDSVKAALETDPTLGGAADDLIVTRCSGYRTFKREGGTLLLGAEWTTEVYASG
jgi:hypothetical protein